MGRILKKWTQDDRDEAVRLWNDGQSAGQIATHFGEPLTRNSVIGIVNRAAERGVFVRRGGNDLSIQASVARARKDKKVQEAKPKKPPIYTIGPLCAVKPPDLTLIKVQAEKVKGIGLGISIMDIGNKACRTIVGEDGRGPLYCGQALAPQSHWCDHCRQTMVRAPERRRTAPVPDRLYLTARARR